MFDLWSTNTPSHAQRSEIILLACDDLHDHAHAGLGGDFGAGRVSLRGGNGFTLRGTAGRREPPTPKPLLEVLACWSRNCSWDLLIILLKIVTQARVLIICLAAGFRLRSTWSLVLCRRLRIDGAKAIAASTLPCFMRVFSPRQCVRRLASRPVLFRATVSVLSDRVREGALSHFFNKKPERLLGSLDMCGNYEPSGLVHEKNEADNDRICSELTFTRYHASSIPAHV